MVRIENGLFVMAALLGIISGTLLSGRVASAQMAGSYCDLTPAGTVSCNCADNGDGTVCVGSLVRLQWCTTTATAPCVSPIGKYCPTIGSQAIGTCSQNTVLVPDRSCTGNLRGNCEQPANPQGS